MKKDQGRFEGIKHDGMHCVFYEWEIRTKELIRRAKEKGRKEEGKKKKKEMKIEKKKKEERKKESKKERKKEKQT